jgi:hypothetical protein
MVQKECGAGPVLGDLEPRGPIRLEGVHKW